MVMALTLRPPLASALGPGKGAGGGSSTAALGLGIGLSGDKRFGGESGGTSIGLSGDKRFGGESGGASGGGDGAVSGAGLAGEGVRAAAAQGAAMPPSSCTSKPSLSISGGPS